MRASKTYRAAAIGHTGAGGYGHGLHLAFQGIENVQVVAVADPDEAGRQKAAAESGAPRAYAEYREMLEKERPEIVSVCPRWTDGHLDMVLACLEAGAHVYCEKPMTATLEEGDQILDVARTTGRKVAVAHQGVYLPGAEKIRQLLGEGRIGRLEAIRAYGKADHRGGGEDMIVLGTHLFNLMRFIAGDVAWVSAQITVAGRPITRADARQPTEPVGRVMGDCVNSTFAFKSGVAGFFESRRDSPAVASRFGLEIVGSEGCLAVRGAAADALAFSRHPNVWPPDSAREWESIPLPEVKNSLALGNQRAIRDLIAAIEADREPISSAADAVAALEMVLGAYEFQITGEQVFLPMRRRKHPLAE